MSTRRADVLLVDRGIFESRARARAAIEAGLVVADGVPVGKPAQMLRVDAVVTAQAPHPYVSRGGVKLAAALDAFVLSPEGLTCLDCGASTGGFSDVLLRRGAAHVMAVDTGREQLHPSLRADARITLLEGVDIRTLAGGLLVPQPSFIVCDVSFISLALVLPALTALSAPSGTLVALVKPQFEVGRQAIGKGGLVKDPAAADAALERIKAQAVALGWAILGVIPSPITGGDGNAEWLMACQR